jgi:hypothetical protein
LLFSVVPIFALSNASAEIASSASNDADYAPLIDSVEADYLRSTADLTQYAVTAEMSPATADGDARITGKSVITYRNHTGSVLSKIFLRLYPNVPEYAEGSMTVSRIRVNGERVDGDLSVGDTLLTIPIEPAITPDAKLRISFQFETVIPTDPVQSYGMFKYDSAANTYSLAHWQPLLAGWDSVAGWNTDPVSQNGDPVFTEAAVFDVELTAPQDLIFATSGSVITADAQAGPATHYASGPSRDFVMTASPDFLVSDKAVGETTVRSFSMPGSDKGAAEVLDDGAQALAVYNDLIGQYPYEELDLVQVNIGNGAGGVEFPGLVFIGSVFYEDEYRRDSVGPGLLEFVVVHEVAHQWFYNVVGNNQYLHAFMDEALANYLSVTYYAATYGAEEADHQANLQLRLGYFSLLFQRGDEVVDQPTDDFASMQDYGATVYGKGALAFMALRSEIGTDAFSARSNNISGISPSRSRSPRT